MMLNTKMSRKGRGDFQVCTKFLSLWTKTQLTEIFVAIFYSLTAARRAPKCNYSAVKHWTNTVQTECQAKWSDIICLLHQHEKGITDLLGFASSPLLSCSRSASRNLHHGLFKDTLWRSESPRMHKMKSFPCQVWISPDTHHLEQRCPPAQLNHSK